VKKLIILIVLIVLNALPLVGQASHQTATVTAWKLNVREVPSLTAKILTVIHYGEVYTVTGQSAEWLKIRVNNTEGWVYSSYVRISDAPSTASCDYKLFFEQPNPMPEFCPNAPMTTQAAYQSYEHGFMLWFANNGSVMVFLNDGRYLVFSEADYAGLPDNAAQAPAGFIQPVSGFGRVWANLNDYSGSKMRDLLGWATFSETAYTATQQLQGRAGHVNFFISLPDNGVINAYSGLAGRRWSTVK
jgi:uncharacterized protein YgiM (DUF1202 family)